MTRKVVLIAGIIFAGFAAICGLLQGILAQEVCTGTNSLGDNYSRVCSSGFMSYVWLFTVASILAMLGLIVLWSQKNMPKLVRYSSFGIFILYGVWLILFSSAIWNISFFRDRQYPEGLNPNCLECSSPTATSLP